MHPKRRQQLVFLLLILFGVGTAAGFVLYALKQNINLFYTPTQIANGEGKGERSVRVGGLVKKGSVQRSGPDLQVSFILTDTAKEVRVNYRGILPDLFREG